MITNADRIRQMSDEELCELMIYERKYCKTNPRLCYFDGMFVNGKYKSGCYICCEEWLKEDAN